MEAQTAPPAGHESRTLFTGVQVQEITQGMDKSVSEITVEKMPPEPHAVHQNISTPLPSELGIYWRSPVTMISTFLLGVGLALALHGYYSSLDGEKVGNEEDQQNALRIGTLLAYLTQTSLVGSVCIAYVQCLWRALKRSSISVEAVDAGTDATKSLLSFLNVEMLSKLKLASIIALVSWYLGLPSPVASELAYT